MIKSIEFEDHTDEELTKAWNYLETLKLSTYVEARMDAIDTELKRRGIVAWNSYGKITIREKI